MFRGDQLLAHASYLQFQLRRQVDPAKEVEAAVIHAVGIVGRGVVLVEIGPEIVVHVHPEEELRPIYPKAQKGFIIVGNGIGLEFAVVLIEIREEIAVPVPAGEYLEIHGLTFSRLGDKCCVKAGCIGEAILVVIVLHQV